MRRAIRTLGVVLSFVTCFQAHASVVSVTRTIDANDVRPGFFLLDHGPTFELAIGDTLVIDFTFLPGQALSLFRPAMIFMSAVESTAVNAIETHFTRQLQFQGLHGPAHDPLAATVFSYGAGFAHAQFSSEFMDDLGDVSIYFTGLRFTFDILGYSGGLVSRRYDISDLQFVADRMDAISIPEPAALPLQLVALLACLHAGNRSRRKQSRVIA